MRITDILELCTLYDISICFGHDSISDWIEIRKGGWVIKKQFIKNAVVQCNSILEYTILGMIKELKIEGKIGEEK